MPSAIDPHRRFQRQVALQAGACWTLAALAAAWAWRAPQAAAAGAAAPRTTPTTATAPAPAPSVDVAAWNVTLWRPFADEAPPAAAPAAPANFKLYSILQQDDGLTAAISAGDNAGMQYVKAGDSGNGFSVVRVEANGVVLRINGQEQRLGLSP